MGAIRRHCLNPIGSATTEFQSDARKTAKGENGEWLMIAPPLISTTDHCDEFLSKLYQTLKDFQKEQGIL